MDIGWRVWLKKDKRKIFGKGPRELLLNVDKLGSLRKAALSMNMSYNKAWNLISNLEESLGFKILQKRVGGVNGGGSSLTKEAWILIDKYEKMEMEIEECVMDIYEKYFINK